MQPNIKLIVIIFNVVLLYSTANALTVSGVVGFGSSTTTNEVSEVESPLTQAFTIEKLLDSKSALGMEHIRSMTTKLTTSIGYTGFQYKYYLNSAPVSYFKVEDMNTNTISYRDYSVYLGSGFGYAQSSRLPDKDGKSSNAAGLYISPRFGVDYQLTRKLGLRSELLIAMTLLGKGSLSTFSLGAGVYYFF